MVQTLSNKNLTGLVAIRPHHVFGAYQTDDIRERACTMLIPHPSAFSGGALTIEVLLLITLIRISGARRLFEFGTYMGGTTVQLAENSMDSAEIFTLDLPADVSGAAKVDANGAHSTTSESDQNVFLSAKATAHGPVIAEGFYGQSPSKKITFLRADSTTADLSAYDRSIDMVWIDGGHDYDTVRSDTANAFRMVNPKNDNAVIVWHDFDNKDQQDVGRFLRELAENRLVYAIGNTLLAVCFPNADGKRFGLS